jgi:hypothetical protein
MSDKKIVTAKKRRIQASAKYGICTACAPPLYGSESLKKLNITYDPIIGAIVVPRELNPCERFSRLDDVSGVPNIDTSGFAEICRNVNPVPSKNNAHKKTGKLGSIEPASSKNIRHAAVDVSNPAIIAFLYPTLSIGSPMCLLTKK